MRKTGFISRLAGTTLQRPSAPSDFLKLSYMNGYPRTYHPGGTKYKINIPQSAKIPFRTAGCPSRLGQGRPIHDVKVASRELEKDRRQLPASSEMDPEPKDIDQSFPRQPAPLHRAMIALGSNIGDRISMIEQACEMMPLRGITVKATSLLYETEPMYVTDQESFFNGVCEVETMLNPHELLDALQAIENDLGRKRVIEKGPRNIDLDIVLYDNQTIADNRLNIPHKLMLEREFVLRPLADLGAYERLPPPYDSKSIAGHLVALDKKSLDVKAMTVMQLSPDLLPVKATNPERQTLIMAVLNITPDSFSDGGLHTTCAKATLESTIREFVQSGASIIDVGGQSTRPHADKISADEELARVLPAVNLIRKIVEGSNVAVSVDTFYSEVAKAAVEAGADVVNDVSAGTLDPEMLRTVAKLRKPIIMMHMRGDPSTMSKMTSYPEGVIQGVGQELIKRVEAASAAGIPRWRIILDPGIGFAKTQSQNLELLRRFEDLRKFPGLQGFPWLVGTSRKGFIGKITGVKEVSQRTWGTAAAVTSSIQGGADIVRVHDVAEMRSVVQMADAIYRVKSDETSQDNDP